MMAIPPDAPDLDVCPDIMGGFYAAAPSESAQRDRCAFIFAAAEIAMPLSGNR